MKSAFKNNLSTVLYLCMESIHFKGEAGARRAEMGGGPAVDTSGFVAILPEALGGLWVERPVLRARRPGRQEQGRQEQGQNRCANSLGTCRIQQGKRAK